MSAARVSAARVGAALPRRVRGAIVVVVLLLGPGALAGCSTPTERYCSVVAEQQPALTQAAGQGGPTALLTALPALRTLQEAAPEDIRGDWDVVVGRLGRLADALDAAGVDPATYDRTSPPASVTDDQRRDIESAARQLATPEMLAALGAVQQQARDVCAMPLVP